jgi:hypothetical protein
MLSSAGHAARHPSRGAPSGSALRPARRRAGPVLAHGVNLRRRPGVGPYVLGLLMTCGPVPLAACTTDDVVRGLAQVSEQVQNISAYLHVAIGLVLFFMVATVVLLFVNGRT